MKVLNRIYLTAIVAVAINWAILSVSCNSNASYDEVLTDYAESFNSQADKLIPLTPAVNSFNARVDDKKFRIDVDMDTTVVKPSGLTPETIKAMLIESLTNSKSGDFGFAETLEATGTKVVYRCTAGDSTILSMEIDPKEFSPKK